MTRIRPVCANARQYAPGSRRNGSRSGRVVDGLDRKEEGRNCVCGLGCADDGQGFEVGGVAGVGSGLLSPGLLGFAREA